MYLQERENINTKAINSI